MCRNIVVFLLEVLCSLWPAKTPRLLIVDLFTMFLFVNRIEISSHFVVDRARRNAAFPFSLGFHQSEQWRAFKFSKVMRNEIIRVLPASSGYLHDFVIKFSQTGDSLEIKLYA